MHQTSPTAWPVSKDAARFASRRLRRMPLFNPSSGSSSIPPWASYTPVLTALAPMTIAYSITGARYIQIGKLVVVHAMFSLTLGGFPSAEVYMTLPVAQSTAFAQYSPLAMFSSVGTVIINTTGPASLQRNNGSEYIVDGYPLEYLVDITYEAA